MDLRRRLTGFHTDEQGLFVYDYPSGLSKEAGKPQGPGRHQGAAQQTKTLFVARAGSVLPRKTALF